MNNLYQILKENFFIIAGPCVIESKDICFEVAEKLDSICKNLKIPYIFKSSFDKANRSSVNSFRGIGISKGLQILDQIKSQFSIPITSDIHENWQIDECKDVLDIIQIPAFLSRQTDLLVNSAKTGKIVNVKKGQFLSGYDTQNIVNKIKQSNNNQIILTERGNSFGYNNLVVDMRNIKIMRQFNTPVVFDATHSVQLPGGYGKSSSGDRDFVFTLAKAAVAAGADGIFMEVHPDPEKALCDGPNSIYLKDFQSIAEKLLQIYNIVK